MTWERQGRTRRGTVLVMIVCMGVCIVVLGLGMLRLALHARLLSAHTIHENAARCAADAGLNRPLPP